MKEISLTQGKVAIVDDEDFEYLNRWKWHARKNGQTWYALRSKSWRIQGKRYGITIPMHRVIMGAPEGRVIDHLNRDGLDNRRSNLRVTTFEENARNRRDRKQKIQMIIDFTDEPSEEILQTIDMFLESLPNVLRWELEKRLVSIA